MDIGVVKVGCKFDSASKAMCVGFRFAHLKKPVLLCVVVKQWLKTT